MILCAKKQQTLIVIVIVTLTVLTMLYFSDYDFDEISDLVCDIYFPNNYNIYTIYYHILKSMSFIYVTVISSNKLYVNEQMVVNFQSKICEHQGELLVNIFH